MSKLKIYYGSTASFSNLYSFNADGVDGHADAGDNAAFSFGNGAGTDSPFSISIWMKRTNSAGLDIVFSKFGSVGGFEYYVFLVGTTLRWGLWNLNGANYMMRTAPMATVGSWVHLCMTYAGNKLPSGLKIYADGVQIDNANLTSGVYSGMSNTITPVVIGSDHLVTAPFIGLLAADALVNIEMSAAQAMEAHNLKMGDMRTTSFAANILFCHYFENGQADFPIWKDYSGNGYDATLHNSLATDINTDVPT